MPQPDEERPKQEAAVWQDGDKHFYRDRNGVREWDPETSTWRGISGDDPWDFSGVTPQDLIEDIGRRPTR